MAYVISACLLGGFIGLYILSILHLLDAVLSSIRYLN